MTNVITEYIKGLTEEDFVRGDTETPLTGRQMYNYALDAMQVEHINIASVIDFDTAYKELTGKLLIAHYFLSVFQRRLYYWMMLGKHGKQQELEYAYHAALAYEWKLRDKCVSETEKIDKVVHKWLH
jgi:hypothetical protein